MLEKKRRSSDPELAALSRVVRILDALSVAERDRVLYFVSDRYDLGSVTRPAGEVTS